MYNNSNELALSMKRNNYVLFKSMLLVNGKSIYYRPLTWFLSHSSTDTCHWNRMTVRTEWLWLSSNNTKEMRVKYCTYILCSLSLVLCTVRQKSSALLMRKKVFCPCCHSVPMTCIWTVSTLYHHQYKTNSSLKSTLKQVDVGLTLILPYHVSFGPSRPRTSPCNISTIAPST